MYPNQKKILLCIILSVILFFSILSTANASSSKTNFNDGYYYKQWHLHDVNFHRLWKYPSRKDIKLAVIDEQFTPNEHVNMERLLTPSSLPTHDNYNNHGQHTIMPLVADNNDKLGGIGLLGDYPVKVVPIPLEMDEHGRSTVKKLTNAVELAIELNVDVISMSLSATEDYLPLREMISKAINKGIIVVACVGNHGKEITTYPAAYPFVIGVGSVNKQNTHSSFSTTGNQVDVVFYGEKIYVSTVDYKLSSGTSLSTPYVAGIIAMAKSVNPRITLRQIDFALYITSTDFGEQGKDNLYGHGLLNMNGFMHYLARIK